MHATTIGLCGILDQPAALNRVDAEKLRTPPPKSAWFSAKRHPISSARDKR